MVHSIQKCTKEWSWAPKEEKLIILLTVDDKIIEVVYFVLYLFAKDAERLAELEKLILKIKEDLGCDC